MSNIDEIEWADIAEFAVLGYLGVGFGATILFYEKMEKVAKKTPDNPRTAWFSRPAIAAAKQINKVLEYLDAHEGVGLAGVIGCGLIGLAAGVTAICFAGPALGATWGGLLTLKGLGLGLGALGIGAAVAPVTSAALAITGMLIVPTAVMLARGRDDIRAEFIAGRAETKEWKKEQGGPAKPHPLVIAAEAKKEEMTEQGTHEREQLFRRLQAKFPAEFAEAVRRSDTDTVLRNKVQVMKPVKIKLQAKKKSFIDQARESIGGGA